MKKLSLLLVSLFIVSIFTLPLKVSADRLGPHVYYTSTTAVGGHVSFSYERFLDDGETCYLEYDPTVFQYVPDTNPMYSYTDSNGKLMIKLAENDGLSGDQPLNPYVEFKVLDTTKTSTVVNIVADDWPYDSGGIPAKIKIVPVKTNNTTCPECEKCPDAKECPKQDANCECDKINTDKNNYDSKFLYASLGANAVFVLGCVYLILSKRKSVVKVSTPDNDLK